LDQDPWAHTFRLLGPGHFLQIASVTHGWRRCYSAAQEPAAEQHQQQHQQQQASAKQHVHKARCTALTAMAASLELLQWTISVGCPLADSVVAAMRASAGGSSAALEEWWRANLTALTNDSCFRHELGAAGACTPVVAGVADSIKRGDITQLDIYMQAMCQLSADGCNMDPLLEESACEAAAAAMRASLHSAPAQELCARTALNMMYDTDGLERLTEAGMCEAVVAALQHHTGAGSVQGSCLTALNRLASRSGAARSRLVAAGGCEAAVAALRAFPAVADVQRYGADSIANLHGNDSADRLIRAGAYTVLVEALSTSTCCMHAIAMLAKRQPARTELSKAGACEALVRALQRSTGDPGLGELWSFEWRAVEALLPDDDNRAKFVAAGVCEAVVAAMQRTASASLLPAAAPADVLLDILEHVPHTVPSTVKAGGRDVAAAAILKNHYNGPMRTLYMRLLQALE
jgi:hypothetical protein